MGEKKLLIFFCCVIGSLGPFAEKKLLFFFIGADICRSMIPFYSASPVAMAEIFDLNLKRFTFGSYDLCAKTTSVG